MKPKFAGYALVELIAVLAILGLVAAMVWPKYQVVADELLCARTRLFWPGRFVWLGRVQLRQVESVLLFLRLVQAVINLPVTRSGRARP